MRFPSILVLTLLTGCTATMKYHMAANQVHAATKKNTGWLKEQRGAEAATVAEANAGDIVAAAETTSFAQIATKSDMDACAATLGRAATATPSLADARQQIEACLEQQGYKRVEMVRFDHAPQRPSCTSLYPLERCPMPVEPKP